MSGGRWRAPSVGHARLSARRRVERLHAVLKGMPPIPCHAAGEAAAFAGAVPGRHHHLFLLGHSALGSPGRAIMRRGLSSAMRISMLADEARREGDQQELGLSVGFT